MCKHEPGTVGSLTDPKVIINELDLEDCLTALVTLVRVYKRKIKQQKWSLSAETPISRTTDFKMEPDCHLFVSLYVFTFFALSLCGVLLSFAM